MAKARLGGMLAVRARAAGLLLLGGERLTVARAFTLEDDVELTFTALRRRDPENRSMRVVASV